jgi:hypothetical protein
MRFKLIILTAAVILVILGAGLGVAAQGRVVSCTFRGFNAVIRKGPTQGLRLSGTLRLTSSYDGSLTGSLLSTDGQVYVKVSGHANGRAINLAFDFGYSGRTQTYLLGVGTMWEPFNTCSGAMGGLFTGPQDGDIGDWGVHTGPPVGG